MFDAWPPSRRDFHAEHVLRVRSETCVNRFFHVVQRPQHGRHPEVPQDQTQVLETVV